MDPYHTHFPAHIRTGMYGKGQIDYILMDATMEWVLVWVGYLALHKGATLDHSYTYTDFEETKLVQRITHHPVDIQS